MAAFAVNEADPLRFSPSERETILSMLDEYTNALDVYQRMLKNPTKHDNDVSVNDTSFVSADLLTSDVQRNLDKTAKPEDKEPDFEKLYQNSLYVRKAIEELKEEIREHGTFDCLTKEIEQITSSEEKEETLFAQQEQLSRSVIDLRKIIAAEKFVNEEKKKRILYELSEEQRNLEKLKLMTDVEKEYVTAWERTKYEQNQLRHNMEIERLEKILNDYRVRGKNEERVHAELTKFLIQETASFDKQAKEWEERYVREKEIHEKEIRQLRIDIESRRKQLDELKEEYHRNQEFIDVRLAEKDALKRQKEQDERMRKGAVKIQAWWRGVMVRRKLGPYRPAEKRKKRQTKSKK